MFERAVHYGQLAGDVERVAELMARGARREVADGRIAMVQRAFTWLADHGPPDPGVAVLGAWLAALSGRPAEAERWLRLAEAGRPDAVQADGSPLEAWVLTLRATMAVVPSDARAAATRALELLAPTGEWRAAATVALGLAELLDGEEERADRHLRDAVELGRATGAAASASVALDARAMVAIRRGNWAAADDLLRAAAAQVAAAHLQGYPTTALGHALAARTAVHAGDLAAARRQIAAGRALLPDLTRAFGLLAVQTRLELARACVASGDAASATDVLDDVLRLLPDRTGPAVLTDDAREVVDLVTGASALRADLPRLTPAELRLVPSLATHLSLPQIARRLSLSPHTVKAQVTAIYRKLSASSRTEAVDRARGLGLLPAPVPPAPRRPPPVRNREPTERSTPDP